MRWILRFLHDDTAATAIEYCIVMTVILLSVIIAVAAVGAGTGGLWGGAQSHLNTTNFGK